MGRSRFVGSGKAVEVGGGCSLESEVTVGELGEVGWFCRDRGRHVGCGLGKGLGAIEAWIRIKFGLWEFDKVWIAFSGAFPFILGTLVV